MKTIELGCTGHFIAAAFCQFRRHTQIGSRYRVSSVGDYFPAHSGKREPIGFGPDSLFETMVFETTGVPAGGNDGCGCIEVKSWSEVDGERYATAGAAQAGHERYVSKYRRKR